MLDFLVVFFLKLVDLLNLNFIVPDPSENQSDVPPSIPPFQFGSDFEAPHSGRSSQSFILTPEQPVAFDAAFAAARTRSSLTDITSTSYSAPSPRVITGVVPSNAQFQVVLLSNIS